MTILGDPRGTLTDRCWLGLKYDQGTDGLEVAAQMPEALVDPLSLPVNQAPLWIGREDVEGPWTTFEL